ncbi:MAG: hypothetical protein MZV70_44080 [Desulfobacterales bacterium]|nr:hypothetical protein [Desulfobacterales bacterium]
MAQAQRLATSADHRFKNLTDVVGTGTLTFQFGTYGGTAGNPTFTANPDQSVKTLTIDASNQHPERSDEGDQRRQDRRPGQHRQ